MINPLVASWCLSVLGIACMVLCSMRPRELLLWCGLFAGASALCAHLTWREWQRRVAAAGRHILQIPSPPPDTPPGGQMVPLWRAVTHVSDEIRREQKTLQESRHQLEVLLEGMQDAVLGVDAAGRVQWSNAQMQRLIDRHAAGASVRHGRALVHTFRDPALLAAVQTTLELAEVAECRSQALLPGRVFQVNASPLPGGGAVVVLHDRTEAEQMERSQRDFVANVSHELRTPLTSILGYVETVLDVETLSPAAQEFLGTVLKNASRMHRLTEELLLLSRVEQAESPLELKPVPASILLRDALRTVSGSAYAEEAVIELRGATTRSVMADEHAIQQVLGNLLENAVKYSETAGASPRIVLSADESVSEPGWVEFSVQDSGPGIAQEHLGRIFERFYRVEKARSREAGGTGLGLAIARSLLEQHGGRIWAESTLGQGSTFLFTLRAAD